MPLAMVIMVRPSSHWLLTSARPGYIIGRWWNIIPLIVGALIRSIWVSDNRWIRSQFWQKISRERDFTEFEFSLRKVLTCLFLSTLEFSQRNSTSQHNKTLLDLFVSWHHKRSIWSCVWWRHKSTSTECSISKSIWWRYLTWAIMYMISTWAPHA